MYDLRAPTLPLGAATVAPVTDPTDPLREAAQGLEAAFLAEMLKAARVGEMQDALGGAGIGGEQFASYLRQAYADEIAAAGGIGLSQALFEAMQARSDV